MSRPRLAVIGAGAWGVNHVRVAATEPRCELAAIADPDDAALGRAAALAPHARVSRDPDRVLGDPSIDAVIIATPSRTHVALAVEALAAGKHVLVEKPLALSLASAARLADPRRVLLVGHLMVYHPAITRMRELVDAGALGRLQYVHSVRANLGRIRADESVLWSFGPHDVSMLDALLDDIPLTVSARGQSVHHAGVHDVVFATIRYASGHLAQLHLSRLHPRKERTLTLVGSRQLVQFDDVAPDKLRLVKQGFEVPPAFADFAEFLSLRDGDVQLPALPMSEPLRLQLHHFLDCLDGATPRTDLNSAMRVTAVLEAAEQSLANDGQPVPIAVNAWGRRNN